VLVVSSSFSKIFYKGNNSRANNKINLLFLVNKVNKVNKVNTKILKSRL